MSHANIQLWRTSPPDSNGNATTINVIPSGRQALTYALRLAGLGRKDRVALPEWSSHCVISSIGRLATPIPLSETTSHSIPVAGVLLYEQWGWPLQYSDEDLENTQARVLILDKVDSATVREHPRTHPGMATYEVFSLSKLLGLRGGGLLRHQGYYHAQPAEPECIELEKTISQQPRTEFWDDILKSDVTALNAELVGWLRHHCALTAIKEEKTRRRSNLERVIQSPVAQSQDWMVNEARQGCAPGIFPFLPSIDPETRKKLSQSLWSEFGIATQGYHFNFSGNPFKPDYRACLAFPIHGQMASPLLEEALAFIEKRIG